MSDKTIHRGETMLVSISADDFPITDLSDVVLTIEHGQTETQLYLDDFILVTNSDIQVQEYQYVMGRYNRIDDKKNVLLVSIIGNGVNGSNMFCSNAHAVDWNGDEWFSGRVFARTEEALVHSKNNDLTIKQYVDDKISDIEIEGGRGINV